MLDADAHLKWTLSPALAISVEFCERISSNSQAVCFEWFKMHRKVWNALKGLEEKQLLAELQNSSEAHTQCDRCGVCGSESRGFDQQVRTIIWARHGNRASASLALFSLKRTP